MKKSVKRSIFNASVISAGAIGLGATMATIISRGLNSKQVGKIVEEINLNRQNVQNHVQTLEVNKNSVDTLRSAINNSSAKLNEYKSNYEKLNKEEYKGYKKIQQALSKFKTKIDELETKITQSEQTLKSNIDTIDKIVKKAKDTSDQAIEKLDNTSHINLPGLSEANEVLQKAINELNEAKKRAEAVDSKAHIDDLVLKAKDVEKAEKHVANLIDTFNQWTIDQRQNAYLEELNKHNKLLNEKLNDSEELKDNLPTISEFIKDFEKKIIVAKDAHNYINSTDEQLPESVLNSNNQLKQVIANSGAKIEELKARLSKIKSEIDANLNELAKKQQITLDKINSTDDFDILASEYNSSNQRLQNDIKNLEDKIKSAEYDDVLNQLAKLKTYEQNNANIALEKLHKNVESTLPQSTYLSAKQVEDFKAQIKSEKSTDKLKELKNNITLTNEKEKAKKQLKDGYELFNDQFKQETFDKIDQATNKDQIDQIISQINELNTDKQDAKSKIDNEFSSLSSEQKNSFINELISATSEQSVKKLLSEIEKLDGEQLNNKYRDEIAKNIEALSQQINDYQKYDNDLSKLNEYINALDQKIKLAENTVGNVEKNAAKTESDTKEINEKLKAKIEEAKKQLETANNKKNTVLTQLTVELEAIEKEIQATTQSINNNKDNFEKLEADFNKYNETNQKIKDLEEKINKVGYQKGAEQVAKLDQENKSNRTRALDMMKALISNELSQAKSLKPEQKTTFVTQITNATNPTELKTISKDIKDTNFKEKAKDFAATLTSLSEEELNKLREEVLAGGEQKFQEIKDKYQRINNEKAELINQVNTFDFTINDKGDISQSLKDKNLDEAKTYFEKIKDINNKKQEVKQAINSESNKISQEKKIELLDKLTKTKTKEEVEKVQKELALNNKKLAAIYQINSLQIPSEEKTKYINEINAKESEDEIDAVVARAKGNMLEAEKAEDRAKIAKLDFISKTEKEVILNLIKTKSDENRTQINAKITELEETNKNKKAIFEEITKNNDLFSEDHVVKIKQSLINAETIEQYEKIKNDLIALKNKKQELKTNLENNTYPNIGANDKEKIKRMLTVAEDVDKVAKADAEAKRINDFKTDLINKVDQLNNVEPAKKADAKHSIKQASSDSDAREVYDKVSLENEKQKAKETLKTLSNLSDAHKREIEAEIDSQTNNESLTNLINKYNELNEYKNGKKYDSVSIENVKKLKNVKAKYDKELIDAKIKEEVNRIVQNYNELNDVIRDAKQKIDKLSNVSESVKSHFKNEISVLDVTNKTTEQLKTEVRNILNKANQTDTTNQTNINKIKGLRENLLTDTYINEKVANIKDQLEADKSNKIVKDAETLNTYKNRNLSVITKLPSIRQNARFANKVKNELKQVNSAQEVDRIVQNYNELNNIINGANQTIERLSNVSNKIKSHFKNQILTLNVTNKTVDQLKADVRNIVDKANETNITNQANINKIRNLTNNLLSERYINKKVVNIKDQLEATESNKIANEAEALNRYKNEKLAAIRRLSSIAQNQDFINIVKNELKQANSTHEVDMIFEKYNSKNTALNTISTLPNLSDSAKQHFKDLVTNSNTKEDVDKHKNNAESANRINGENIKNLNNLALLNQPYKNQKINIIKNSTESTNRGNGKNALEDARQLSAKKQAAKNEIKRTYTKLTKEDLKELEADLINANTDVLIQPIKNKANLLNEKYKAKEALGQTTKYAFLSDKERADFKAEIEGANLINKVNEILEKAKNTNAEKQKLSEDISNLSESYEPALINKKKEEIKKLSKDEAKELAIRMEAGHLILNQYKNTTKSDIKGTYNAKMIKTPDKQAFYDKLIDKIKIEEGILDAEAWTGANIKNKFNEIKNVANQETELFVNKDASRLSLNDEERNTYQNKINALQKGNNNPSLESLNKIKEIIAEANNLSNNKNKLLNEFDKLTSVKASLKQDAKNSIKNVTKEQLEAKLNELRTLNSNIAESVRVINSEKFKVIDNKRAAYVQEIQGAETVHDVEEIMKRAEHELFIANKYNELKNKVIAAEIGLKRTTKLLAEIGVAQSKNTDNNSDQFTRTEKEINSKLAIYKKDVDAYRDAEFDLLTEIKTLTDDDSNSKVKLHKQIVDEYQNKILRENKAKYQEYLDEAKLPELTSELVKTHENLSKYVKRYAEIKKYIDQHTGTNEIKDAVRLVYANSTIDIRKQVAGAQVLKNMDQLIDETFNKVKVEAFKKEIIRIIGNGTWYIDSGRTHDTHPRLIINDAHASFNGQTIVLNKDQNPKKGHKYTFMYPKFKVEFRVARHNNSEKGWPFKDFWVENTEHPPILLKSGDTDDIQFQLTWKHHTYFQVYAVPTYIKYIRGEAFPEISYNKGTDSSKWFKENNLKPISFKGKKF